MVCAHQPFERADGECRLHLNFGVARPDDRWVVGAMPHLAGGTFMWILMHTVDKRVEKTTTAPFFIHYTEKPKPLHRIADT